MAENGYDMAAVKSRYFHAVLRAQMDDGTEKVITVDALPPKLKFIRKLSKVVADEETGIDDLREAVAKIFSRNKDNVKVPPEFIDEFDEDGLAGICTAYFDWVGEAKKN
jgi:hypothetical protein